MRSTGAKGCTWSCPRPGGVRGRAEGASPPEFASASSKAGRVGLAGRVDVGHPPNGCVATAVASYSLAGRSSASVAMPVRRTKLDQGPACLSGQAGGPVVRDYRDNSAIGRRYRGRAMLTHADARAAETVRSANVIPANLPLRCR